MIYEVMPLSNEKQIQRVDEIRTLGNLLMPRAKFYESAVQHLKTKQH